MKSEGIKPGSPEISLGTALQCLRGDVLVRSPGLTFHWSQGWRSMRRQRQERQQDPDGSASTPLYTAREQTAGTEKGSGDPLPALSSTFDCFLQHSHRETGCSWLGLVYFFLGKKLKPPFFFSHLKAQVHDVWDFRELLEEGSAST